MLLTDEEIAQEKSKAKSNAAKKKRIRDSRVDGTSLLCQTLANLPQKPSVLVSASAIGFYGDCDDVELDEASNDAWKQMVEELSTDSVKNYKQ